MQPGQIEFETPSGRVGGLVDRASTDCTGTFVFAHGAGAGMNHTFMQQLAEAVALAGLDVVRFEFPYMAAGRSAPGSASASEAAFRAVADEVRQTSRGPLILGGKSYGGRIASHIVAQGYPAGGLVFVGYPLHPPGRPEKIRDAHLGDIAVPMLFLQGTRDAFATADLLHPTVKKLKTASLVEIEGGDHSFKVSRRPTGAVISELAGHICTFAAKL